MFIKRNLFGQGWKQMLLEYVRIGTKYFGPLFLTSNLPIVPFLYIIVVVLCACWGQFRPTLRKLLSIMVSLIVSASGH